MKFYFSRVLQLIFTFLCFLSLERVQHFRSFPYKSCSFRVSVHAVRVDATTRCDATRDALEQQPAVLRTYVRTYNDFTGQRGAWMLIFEEKKERSTRLRVPTVLRERTIMCVCPRHNPYTYRSYLGFVVERASRGCFLHSRKKSLPSTSVKRSQENRT